MYYPSFVDLVRESLVLLLVFLDRRVRVCSLGSVGVVGHSVEEAAAVAAAVVPEPPAVGVGPVVLVLSAVTKAQAMPLVKNKNNRSLEV